MDDSLLPEEDSIFNNLSGRTDNLSSDAFVEDVNLDDVGGPQCASTPVKGRQQSAPRRQSPRLRARTASPSPSTSSPPATLFASPSRQSPRLRARLALPATTPPRLPPITPAGPSAIVPLKSKGTKGKEKNSTATPRLKCPKCPATLLNKKTLDTHLRSHVLKGVTSKAPTLQEIHQVMGKLVKEAFQEILDEKVIGDISAAVKCYVEKLMHKLEEPFISDELINLLSENFFSIMKDKTILFPSSIRHSVYSGTNVLLSSMEFTNSVKSAFLSLEMCEGGVVNVLIGNFMFTLCNRFLIFSIRHMRGVAASSKKVEEYKKRSKDSIDSQDFRQLVYHIGGSIVSGFMWKGMRYSKTSHIWVSYCDVFKENFLIDEAKSNQCSEEVRSFSDKRDRGGYKHINDETFSFFLIVFDMIMFCEGEDGSLPPNIIDENILSSDVVLCLWDALVGNKLNQDHSLDLLVQVCNSCIKVVKKGIMKRRLNKHLLQPYDSVAMRAKLAS